jgi:hypothetical protein
VRFAAAAFVLALLASGCGGSSTPKQPQTAHLTSVAISGAEIRFEFDAEPDEIRADYEPRAQLAECGSGMPIRLRGSAFAVVHFQPAASARFEGEKVVLTYTGPKRLRGSGPVLEAVRSCDFEADLGWAIGVQRKLDLNVSRDGSAVTVSFG